MQGIHIYDRYGNWRFPGIYSQEQTPWDEQGSISSQQAALAVDARDHASVEALVDAKKVIISPDDGTTGLEIRFRGDGGDETQNVIQLYAEAGEDYYTKIATLTLTEGLQEAATGKFIQNISESNGNWMSPRLSLNVADHIARYYILTHGYSKFLMIASTLNASNIYVDLRCSQKQKS